ncbi:MAG: hypothetical protein NT046_08455 [Arenimonas sp.]|nr:hypothetical protein [Arenimonas sp.]
MSRPSLLIALSLVLAPGLLFAQETTVYKSKNADGTSVYTQIETRGAERSQVESRDPALAPAEAKPKSETEVACERAQANLTLIGSGKTLQRDKNGDGTPEDLTPEEVASERDLATRQVTAYCAKPEA